MPTVLRIGGYRLFFFSHEPNEPPHIHVDRAECSAKLWLEPVSLARNAGFAAHELRAILRVVNEHRPLLLEAWHEYFD